MYSGIDASRWQGNIDWKKVADAGINFCIVKAGGSDSGFYRDKNFIINVTGALQNQIHVGAYYFVGGKCKSAADGQADAVRFYNIIKDFPLDYPVYIDFEAPDRTNKQGNTDACNAFCAQMEKYGYYAGIYASDISGFKDRLYLDQLTKYDKWVARYGSQPKYVKKYGIWQSSSRGVVSGIRGFVDSDLSMHDYAKIIRDNHLNGF